MQELSALYRLLGDEVRLRLLRLLQRERLNVSELTAILGIAQSGVSRHLGLLREAGLLEESREGGYAYYRFAPGNGHAGVGELLRQQFAMSADAPIVRADEARLHEVLRLRKESFRQHGSADRQLVPGRSWAAWARALGLLMPPLTVADLGCGEGYLTLEAAAWARRVIAVDASREVLQRARALAARRGIRNITWRQGRLDRVPLRDEAVDLVLFSQALHHAHDPEVALREAARILRDEGRVLLLDLKRHDQSWVRERLGDRWLGFTDAELKHLFAAAGFIHVQLRTGARLSGDPFTVVVGAAAKASGQPRTRHEEPRPAPGTQNVAPRTGPDTPNAEPRTATR